MLGMPRLRKDKNAPPLVFHFRHGFVELPPSVTTPQQIEEFLCAADDWMNAKLSEAWQLGYTAGHSRAMRRMSDEPGVEDAKNPFE